MRSIVEAYLYSSVHVALIAGLSFYCLNSGHIDSRIASILVTCLVFIYYNLSRIYRVKNFESIQNNRHLLWISKNLTELLFALGFSFLCLFFLGRKLGVSFTTIAWLIFLGGIYLFIRENPFIKNIVIAKAWTVMFGILGLESDFLFAYILAMSIWYDFKDDKHYDYSKIVVFLIASATAVYIFSEQRFLNSQAAIILLCIHWVLFFFTLKIRSEYVFLFLVDLMILGVCSSFYLQ
jgi:hypothetical protein